MTDEVRREDTNGEGNGVKISRDFDFPRKSIFEMLTDPKKAAT